MGGFLIWVVIIIFVIASNNKKKSGAQAGKPAAPARAAREQTARGREAAQAVAVSKLSARERAERMQALKEKRAARERARTEAAEAFPEAPSYGGSPAAQGASAFDGEGCVGGSLEHDHTEGESHEEHARHVAALRQREREEALSAQAAADLAEMNVRKLRQAVVMAEVLGKPKALQKRA